MGNFIELSFYYYINNVMKKVTLFLALTCVFCNTVYSQANSNDCLKRIKIRAIPYEGKQWVERTMEVYVHYKELTKQQIANQLIADSLRYQGWDFRKLENPSNIMDCAGYTYHNMFSLAGKYWITAEKFYQNLILPYAKQISDRTTWGDARVNDIVVFKLGGEAKHISYISKVEKTLGQVTSITIITKDAREAVYTHRIGYFLSDIKTESNPLVQSMGYPYIYRLNYGNFDINESFYKDCQTPPKQSATYTLKEVIVDSNSYGYADKKITANEFYFSRTEDGGNRKKYFYQIKLLGNIPETIEPGEKFEMPMSLETTIENPSFDFGVMVSWYCDDQYLWKNSADKHLWVGKMAGKTQTVVNDKIVITTPACTPQKLICCFQKADGYALGEGRTMNWIKLVYEKQ